MLFMLGLTLFEFAEENRLLWNCPRGLRTWCDTLKPQASYLLSLSCVTILVVFKIYPILL